VTRRAWRQRGEAAAIVLIMMFLAGNSLRAQEQGLELPHWVWQQGGLTVALFVLAYFYRRDLLLSASEKHESVALLVEIVKENTAAKADLMRVVDALTVELRERRRTERGD
jgi:hypothetical protein